MLASACAPPRARCVAAHAVQRNSHSHVADHASEISRLAALDPRLSLPADHAAEPSRRGALLALAGATAAASLAQVGAAQAKGPATRTAGAFCPPSDSEGYVRYTPDARATPSIRAGVIQPDFYSFDLPPSWSEGTILNILSGNFCMPRCDEPWYETVWESAEDGRAKLVVSPLYRMISKGGATLKDLGPPEQVVERIGPFITGNYLDSVEDVVAMDTVTLGDGRTYYTYELAAPYAKDGARLLAAFAIKVRGRFCCCGVVRSRLLRECRGAAPRRRSSMFAHRGGKLPRARALHAGRPGLLVGAGGQREAVAQVAGQAAAHAAVLQGVSSRDVRVKF